MNTWGRISDNPLFFFDKDWHEHLRGWNFISFFLVWGHPNRVFLTQARPLPKNHFVRRGSWTLSAMWETWPQESLFEPNDDWTQWWLQLSIKVGARVGRLSKLMKCISYYLKEPGVEGEVNYSSQGWWGKEVREGLLPRKLTNISPQERWLEGEIFPLNMAPFQGTFVSFRGGSHGLFSGHLGLLEETATSMGVETIPRNLPWNSGSWIFPTLF